MKNKYAGVERVIRAIYVREGEVKASMLLEEARDKKSPAHSAFEWDDGAAAEEYRLYQARHLLRIVTVIHDDKPSKLANVSAEKGDDSREGAYKPIAAIVESPTEFETVLSSALRRLGAARLAVEELQIAARKLSPTDDRVSMIAQIAEALSLLNTALDKAVH